MPERSSFHDVSMILPADVEQRLVEAMLGLWGLPGRVGPDGAGVSALWRQVRSDIGADDEPPRRRALSRREYAEMEEALDWMDHVPAGDTRRIVALAIGQLAHKKESRIDWPAIFRILERRGVHGFTTDGLRMRYGRALEMICNRLNAAEKQG